MASHGRRVRAVHGAEPRDDGASLLAERPLTPDLDELLDVAREAAAAAAREALAWQGRSEALDIQEKAASDDLVSQADREAEEAVRRVLAERRPDDAVDGEEAGRHGGSTGVRWHVDPIDGTTNYVYGRPDWAVSVAVVDEADGRILAAVVEEPALGRVTHARLGGGAWSDGRPARCSACEDLTRAIVEINLGTPPQRSRAGAVLDALVGRIRDIRRGGSAAAALAQVATGRADAYWGPGLQAWDGAAGMLLVAEAGGSVGDLAGHGPAIWPPGGDVLGAAPALFDPLRQLIAEVWTR